MASATYQAHTVVIKQIYLRAAAAAASPFILPILFHKINFCGQKQSQFVVTKCYSIFEVTERLFPGIGRHRFLCPDPKTLQHGQKLRTLRECRYLIHINALAYMTVIIYSPPRVLTFKVFEVKLYSICGYNYFQR